MGFCEFKVSLVYVVSSGSARATQRDIRLCHKIYVVCVYMCVVVCVYVCGYVCGV